MSIRRLAPLLALPLLAACASGAGASQQESGFRLPIPHVDLSGIGIGRPAPKGHLEKSAFSETPIQLWADTTLGDDCTPVGVTQLEVTTPPAHGAVKIRPGKLYALYPAGHPRDYCSGRLVTGMLAVYTAEKAYGGPDQVVLRATTADGVVQVVTVDIAVEARAARVARPRPSPPVRPAGAAPRTPPVPADIVPAPTLRNPNAPAPEVMRTPFPNG